MNELEKDYSVAIASINKKLAAAGKLIEEAGEIGEAAGIPMLNVDPYDYENGEYTNEELEELEETLYNIEFGPLLNAMDAVGWRTSSLFC